MGQPESLAQLVQKAQQALPEPLEKSGLLVQAAEFQLPMFKSLHLVGHGTNPLEPNLSIFNFLVLAQVAVLAGEILRQMLFVAAAVVAAVGRI
jgi:hypothetical protein